MNEIIQTVKENPEGIYVAITFVVIYLLFRSW